MGAGFWPGSERRVRTVKAKSLAEDLAHAVVEGKAEDGGEEVDGVAGGVAFGPSPVGVFDDESGECGEMEVVGIAFGESDTEFLQERRKRDVAGSADLFACPARVFVIGQGGHGHFSSVVE